MDAEDGIKRLQMENQLAIPGDGCRYMAKTMDKSASQVDAAESQWCLVGNIVERRQFGEGGHEARLGTKHFSGGTKVHCLPAQWGDGYDQIFVIGRHRGSKQFKTMIISSD